MAICLWGALICAPLQVLSDETPKRVVSINLCTDQLAMLVAGEDQLLSVSRLALDPHSSAMVHEAAAYQINHGFAEEIHLMQPDLVLASRYSAGATMSMLKRLGIPVAVLEPAMTLDQVRDQVLQMGEILGQEERAGALVAEFDARLSAFREDDKSRPRVALYHANGYTAGDKTLAGQILMAAGLANIAAEVGYPGGGVLPLEVLAMARPDAVITSGAFRGASRAEEVMTHPVIQSLRNGHAQEAKTGADWVCGTPFVLRAISAMVDLRHSIEAAAP